MGAHETVPLAALEAEHQALGPQLERFRGECIRQVTSLLERTDATLAMPIESRVKTWESIQEKLDRKGYALGSVRELPDLVGARLILLYRRDVDPICALLAATFEVVEREDTLDRLTESQFGYASIHFILRFPTPWLALPTLGAFTGFQVELQVRTAAQHIWAAASHTLQYKHEAGVPPPVRRAIHRVSALLETVDLEFERVLAERAAYVARADDVSAAEPLNVDLLARVVAEVWPPEWRGRRDQPDRYAELLEDLNHFGVGDPETLRATLHRRREAVLRELAQHAERRRAEGSRQAGGFDAAIPERAGRGGGFVRLTREALRAEFGERWDRYAAARGFQAGRPARGATEPAV